MSSAPEHVVEPAGGPEPRAGGATTAHDELRKMARGSTLNLVGAVCTAGVNFVLVVIVAQGFSQAQAGIFFAATSLFLLVVAMGQLGTTTGMVYFISRARALGQAYLFGSYVRAGMWPVLVLSVVLGGCLVVFAPEVAQLANRGDPGQLEPYLRTLGLFVPVACLGQLGLTATRGLHTMRPSAYIDRMGRPLLQLALVAVVAWLADPALLTWAWVLPTIPAGIWVWLWWRRLQRRALARPGRSAVPAEPVHVGPAFWRFTGPRALGNVAQMALQRLDIVLVAALRGPVEAAVYAAATRFLVLGQMGSQGVSMAVQPRIGAALAREERGLACQLYGTSTAWLVLITWPVYLMFASFGPFLLGIFGEDYRAGADVLLLLSLSMLVATGCGMVDMVLNMAGRTTWTLANSLLALVIMVGLDLWLIPPYGILGAAIGWAVARLTANLVPLAQLALSLRIHPFGRPLNAAMLTAALSFGLLPLLSRMVFGLSLTALLVAVATAGVCYLALLALMRDRLELAALAAVRRRGRGG